jgi:hypothetical protein
MALEPAPLAEAAVLFEVESQATPSTAIRDLRDKRSSMSSMSSSESDIKEAYSGAVVLLSLRRRRKHGPTLPSRLAGATEDGLLLLLRDLEALLDRRRIILPFPVEPTGALVPKDMTSAIALGLQVMLVPKELAPRELVLVFRERIGSGNSKPGGQMSTSWPRPRPNWEGSGDAWSEELVVRMAVSGDMMGDPCCELEALEEELMADIGKMVDVADVGKLVWTWLGRERLNWPGLEAIVEGCEVGDEL